MHTKEISCLGGHLGEAAAIQGCRFGTRGHRRTTQFLVRYITSNCNHFRNVSRSINGLNFTIRYVLRTLEELNQDIVKREAHLIKLRDAYADFEQKSSSFSLLGGMTSLGTRHSWWPWRRSWNKFGLGWKSQSIYCHAESCNFFCSFRASPGFVGSAPSLINESSFLLLIIMPCIFLLHCSPSTYCLF